MEFIFRFWKFCIPKMRCCITVANRYWHNHESHCFTSTDTALDSTRQGHLLTTSTTTKALCHQCLANPASAVTCHNAATLPAREDVTCTAGVGVESKPHCVRMQPLLPQEAAVIISTKNTQKPQENSAVTLQKSPKHLSWKHCKPL